MSGEAGAAAPINDASAVSHSIPLSLWSYVSDSLSSAGSSLHGATDRVWNVSLTSAGSSASSTGNDRQQPTGSLSNYVQFPSFTWHYGGGHDDDSSELSTALSNNPPLLQRHLSMSQQLTSAAKKLVHGNNKLSQHVVDGSAKRRNSELAHLLKAWGTTGSTTAPHYQTHSVQSLITNLEELPASSPPLQKSATPSITEPSSQRNHSSSGSPHPASRVRSPTSKETPPEDKDGVETDSATIGASNNATPGLHHLADSIGAESGSFAEGEHLPGGSKKSRGTEAEIASRLAEGTIRALRDLALDEAVELHDSLRYWTERWERPFLSWVEAGPSVWFSAQGYDHRYVGKKVSHIQAVLARRCASIGELQQHLLRAGWQRGVAQWGVLGQGNQWAAVAGGDGLMDTTTQDETSKRRSYSEDSPAMTEASLHILDHPSVVGATTGPSQRSASSARVAAADHVSQTLHRTKLQSPDYYGRSSVLMVKNERGGEIETNDLALASWAIDAIRVVRDQLYRAGNGSIRLPYIENWPQEENHFEWLRTSNNSSPSRVPIAIAEEEGTNLPMWANEKVDDMKGDAADNSNVQITDLSLMASEVSGLLDAIQIHMKHQRSRRLEKLKPLPYIRRRWYITAIAFPSGAYILYHLLKDGTAVHLIRFLLDKIRTFFADHVSLPIRAIYRELLSRRERDNISDRKARIETMASLKNMIRSWLDDTYPEMPLSQRELLASSMDVSLIERKKEDSIKHIYEINSVVRMSLIEMQFIKKELMNAMYAMDELMSSNEININLASVTPAVLLLYGANHTFKFLYYALLKLGKSREETYASFRLVLLDMERLLLMRSNPPLAPPPLTWGESSKKNLLSSPHFGPNMVDDSSTRANNGDVTVLKSDDLGMFMLHIHECRTILWRNRKRFTRQIIRDVSEDLSELAGERGPVSVQQQLQIMARMARTYPFLKVVSTGVALDISRFVQ